MLEFDEESGHITWKIVYYGPALSGKTTNLICLHDRIGESKGGRMMQIDTRGDRTIFFDLLPFSYRTESGARLKIKVYTVPGQVQHNATRKSVLMRADGVVFVADSQRSQSLHNSESFSNLDSNCRQAGLDFETLPLVVQYNKRDLGEEIVVPEHEVREKWRPAGIPLFFSSALYGTRVAETFESAVVEVYRSMDERFDLSASFGIHESGLVSYLRETGQRKAV